MSEASALIPFPEAPAASRASNEDRERSRRSIVIRGARQHNLKNIDIELPRGKLIVFTGPSGSGKSSLAFDTIYAEGQRRYVESLSAYARQFLERMDKPDVDLITGLAPAIAIEQKTTSRNPRSTVATQTEIYDHLRLLFARIGKTISPVSGQEVTKDSPRSAAETIDRQLEDGARFYLCFPIPDRKGVPAKKELEALKQRGFFRILALPTDKKAQSGGEETIIDLNETATDSVRTARERLLVLVDRLAVKKGDEPTLSRMADSIELAFREGGGRCVVKARDGSTLTFSETFDRDGIRFDEPTPHLFSFNNPVGACKKCQGFSRVQGLDEDLIIPNPELSIRQQAVAPFRSAKWGTYFKDLVRMASEEKIDLDMPYTLLSPQAKLLVWAGKGGYVGINGFFQYLEKNAYKMHYRIFHSRYRGYMRCPECNGYRLRKEALYVKLAGHHIGELCELTTRDASVFFEGLTLSPYEEEVAGRLLEEIRKRLKYLVEVGLDYLTLDRLSQTLSGGESQRINLATSLGSSLVGSLYVLDEPSIGLHPRDTGRLIKILEHLRDIGNTVIVVEHEAEMMRRSDQIVDLGPGSGKLGGAVMFQGTYPEILVDEVSLTGAYLSGRKRIEPPTDRRPVNPEDVIVVRNARQHNLKRVDATFPLGIVTCVTGVSGSGKSTLVHDTLYQGLRRIKGEHDGESGIGKHDIIEGHHLVTHVEMVDQSPIGRSPRSNPVTYIKAFDAIRELLAATSQARIRGLRPGYFSFNVPGGRCETCQGEGIVKIEMQFLADLYLECEACKGKRYKQDTLEITFKGKNVADILDMTVDEAVAFFAGHTGLVEKLTVLRQIGLGYLTLGQPANTLSGGEAQRIKLAAHLGKTTHERTLYLFDEPTTGLHFDDIRKLLGAFQALVEAGHSVIIIEHNLDVIKSADWLIELGPEGGIRGGFVSAEGTPEAIAENPNSVTGVFLKPLL
ncbi:MAG: excinuclease ABC subunit UvrA [Rhodothermales bacterium]|nr:excinuclease ABC subunit UvrA [Rhodothermales bacterium]